MTEFLFFSSLSPAGLWVDGWRLRLGRSAGVLGFGEEARAWSNGARGESLGGGGRGGGSRGMEREDSMRRGGAGSGVSESASAIMIGVSLSGPQLGEDEWGDISVRRRDEREGSRPAEGGKE